MLHWKCRSGWRPFLDGWQEDEGDEDLGEREL